MSLRMKSFACSEMPLKLSDSKSQSHLLTFCIVSTLSSPANGDRPLRLKHDGQGHNTGTCVDRQTSQAETWGHGHNTGTCVDRQTTQAETWGHGRNTGTCVDRQTTQAETWGHGHNTGQTDHSG